MTTTGVLVKGAEVAVLWDAARGHVYARGVDLRVEDGRIAAIGALEARPGERVLDASARALLPGTVAAHAHLSSTYELRGLREDAGSVPLSDSLLHAYSGALAMPEAFRRDAVLASAASLLRSGCTTAVDVEWPWDGWLEALAETGLRAVAAASFAEASHVTPDGHRMDYAWDEARGERELEAALAACDAAGRMGLEAMVSPAQADSVGEELMVASKREAGARRLRWQTHAAQSDHEFREMMARRGLTPVGWLSEIGVLDARSSLAHANWTDAHPQLRWPERRDLALLAGSGAQVVHCPVSLIRRGRALHSPRGYAAAGVRLALGVDTAPMEMGDELRAAVQLARQAEGHTLALDSAGAFEMATVGGAAVLGRDDIGRLEVGAQADLVLMDLDHPSMRPGRDPLRMLVHCGAAASVREVFVAGRQVVEEGRVTAFDEDAATRRLVEGQARALDGVASRHWSGLSGAQVLPPSLPDA